VSLRAAFLLTALLGLGAPSGCHRHDDDETDDGTQPVSNELAPLVLADDTANLLLTWVDEKGDFHVTQKPADVPEKARNQVRAVVAGKEEGTGRLVYVADLTHKAADGRYTVKTMTRAQWDEIGASRRAARIEAFAPKAAPPPSASAGPTGADAGRIQAGELTAVVYGADWCKPCHQAERYLKTLGVRVIVKDIDHDEGAQAEMVQKLRRAGLPTRGSIPVIDIAGQVLVGFSAADLRRAVDTARKSDML